MPKQSRKSLPVDNVIFATEVAIKNILNLICEEPIGRQEGIILSHTGWDGKNMQI